MSNSSFNVGYKDSRVMAAHPLLSILEAAARGTFPSDDGRFHMLPPFAGGRQAVVCFTGCAYICSARPANRLAAMGCDGFGGALRPDVLLYLAGSGGHIHELDVTLAAIGLGLDGTVLPPALDDLDHPRVTYARRLRQDVKVYGDARGFVTLSSGLAQRDEISVELPIGRRGSSGDGRSLLRDVVAAWPAGRALFAAVSPGNSRSLRSFLAAGFKPLGSEVLIDRRKAFGE